MKLIKILAVIFSLFMSGLSLEAQINDLDSLTAVGLYEGQTLEVTLENTSASELCMTYIFVQGSTADQGNIIIQDDVMRLHSGQLVLMVGESRKVYFPLDASVGSNSTLTFLENCAVEDFRRVFEF